MAGDVAFLLEPDLKESHGGLRDVSVLRAISAYAPLLADYADLASLEPATALLTRVRVELHRIAGREQDKLLLQDQDQIAAALAFDDADVLMAAVSDRRTPDRLGQRRRVAPAPAVGPDAPRRAAAGARGDERSGKDGRDATVARGPGHGRCRRRDRAAPDGRGLGGHVARLSTGRHRGRARPAHRQGIPAPAGRPHAAARRPLGPRASWPP